MVWHAARYDSIVEWCSAVGHDGDGMVVWYDVHGPYLRIYTLLPARLGGESGRVGFVTEVTISEVRWIVTSEGDVGLSSKQGVRIPVCCTLHM